mmetsp:Transcript_13628/g.23932  ORF Transcript_13628/g.23932 Transcript_13628/m.23932 type:complete len:249 (+) Transcript_13628:107-853(+)
MCFLCHEYSQHLLLLCYNGCISMVCLFLGDGEALGDVLPVDDLPDALQVVRANVLVLQVVSVLPDINAKQRHQAGGGLEGILVGGGGDSEALAGLVVAEPAPSAALHSNRGSSQSGLHTVQGAILGLDHVQQVAVFNLASTLLSGGKVVEENGVVQVSTPVELDALLQGNDLGDVVLVQSLAELLVERVQVGDVGLVVLAVVDLHDLSRDERLKLGVVILQIGESKLGGRHLSRCDLHGGLTNSSDHL